MKAMLKRVREEADLGAPSERRILEYAKEQAKQEAEVRATAR